MIRITSVSLPIGFTDKTVRKAVCKKLRIDESQTSGASLYRCSIDARKKDNIHYTATIDVNFQSVKIPFLNAMVLQVFLKPNHINISFQKTDEN